MQEEIASIFFTYGGGRIFFEDPANQLGGASLRLEATVLSD